MPARVKVIGLTGGIGSGKSTVASVLEEFGAAVIHADAVGHEIYAPMSEGWRRVTEAFGPTVVRADQSIDRKRLGAIVFADPAGLQRLNAILHPLMFAEIRRRIDAYRAAGRREPVVLEAAVLIEAKWLPLVDEVWLVMASKQAVTERLTASRALSPSEVEARIKSQVDDLERRRFAHVVFENSGSVDELRRQVHAAWQRATGSSP
jgi:dephospho-CoA kinase